MNNVRFFFTSSHTIRGNYKNNNNNSDDIDDDDDDIDDIDDVVDCSNNNDK